MSDGFSLSLSFFSDVEGAGVFSELGAGMPLAGWPLKQKKIVEEIARYGAWIFCMWHSWLCELRVMMCLDFCLTPKT